MPNTLEKDYVMVNFTIYDGEREYSDNYYYNKNKYDKMTPLEIISDFYGEHVSDNEAHKVDSYWDCDRVIQLDSTYQFKADENKLKEYATIGIWGNA